MNTITFWLAAIFLALTPLPAHDSSIITMDQEPHHHLALHNDFVKVFKVEVAPGDSIVLHRHDGDTVAIAVGDQEVAVGIPGKPDVHSKNADGQVRLQRGGYMHSTHVDGEMPYHTVAVELMRPQSGFHNICAAILPNQPLNCPETSSGKASGDSLRQALLESDQTRVQLVRVPPHKVLDIAAAPQEASQVVVALDAASISSGSSKDQKQSLQPGDFAWIEDGNGHHHLYRNDGDREIRFIEFIFPQKK